MEMRVEDMLPADRAAIPTQVVPIGLGYPIQHGLCLMNDFIRSRGYKSGSRLFFSSPWKLMIEFAHWSYYGEQN